MAFSYSFFLVLLLLFPGLCFRAGWRAGSRTDFLHPSPDKPNSTLTLFLIMLGTIGGHLAGASLFAAQAWLCHAVPYCVAIAFDPNIYRTLLRGGDAARSASDVAIEGWLFSILLIGVVTGGIAVWLSRRDVIATRLAAVNFGWLAEAAQAVKTGETFVIAYVLTKAQHDGAMIAYQGAVRHLALDEDQSIKLIVLDRVDRFIVRIDRYRLDRVDIGGPPIARLQITASEIANVALEVIRIPSGA